MATSFAVPVRRRLSRLVLLAAFAALAVPHASAASGSYGWPLKPFDQQHPVRGFFGDPRIGEAADGHVESKTFHFGIDISAPDGTAVYASTSGRIVWEPQRPETIAIRTADGTVFAYWHIIPAVHNGQYAVAYRTVLGHISKGWGHVHLAELVDGRYVNPLRRGAITPYADTTRPTVHTFSFEREREGARRLSALRPVRPRRRDLGRHADGRPRKVGRQAGHARSRPLAHPQPERRDPLADGGRLLDDDSGSEHVRRGVRAVDAAEPCLARGPVPACSSPATGTAEACADGRPYARGRSDRHPRQPGSELDALFSVAN